MPRMLDNVSAAHRPPRQVKAGLPPGRGAVKGARGQPPFIQTATQRAEVRKLRACGFTTDSISVIMTIPAATLERHFAWELEHGKTLVDARILGGIVDMALDGDRTMSIFYARARGGWRQSGSDDQSQPAAVFSINISSNGHGVAPDESHQITIKSLPQPEDEP
jgi:hypothetical protein